jgi:PAT family beta-lactamase induction signal transducer AmpG
VHNAFAATQDVASTRSPSVLLEHERGVANGFMFAGASVGQTVGGAGGVPGGRHAVHRHLLVRRRGSCS